MDRQSEPWGEESRPAQTLINQGSWRRMAGIYLLMIVSYLVIGSIVSFKRLSLPASKSVSDATGPFDFSTEWAWQHLEQIAQKPHPINSRENLRIREYLLKTVQGLQEEAQQLGRVVDLGQDNVKMTQARNFLSNATRLEFYESSNILVRVVGTEGRAENSIKGHPEAVVVDAHFGKCVFQPHQNTERCMNERGPVAGSIQAGLPRRNGSVSTIGVPENYSRPSHPNQDSGARERVVFPQCSPGNCRDHVMHNSAFNAHLCEPLIRYLMVDSSPLSSSQLSRFCSHRTWCHR